MNQMRMKAAEKLREQLLAVGSKALAISFRPEGGLALFVYATDKDDLAHLPIIKGFKVQGVVGQPGPRLGWRK